MRCSVKSGVVVAFVLATIACARVPVPESVKSVAPEHGYRTLELLPTDPNRPNFARLAVSGSEQGAAIGASQGALGSLAAGDRTGQVGAGLVLMPIAALVGALVGAARARPDEDVRKAEMIIKTSYENDQPAQTATDYLINESKRLDLCGIRKAVFSDETPARTIIEIHTKEFGLLRVGSIDPEIRPFVAAEVRIRNLESPSDIVTSAHFVVGEKISLFDVLDDNGRSFMTTKEDTYERFARQLEAALFGAPLGSSRSASTLEKC